MRVLRAGLIVALAGAGVATSHVSPPVAAADGAAEQVTVEILTDHPVQVAADVREAGGTVTGSVPGSVVQAIVPATMVDAIAAIADVDQVRSLQRAGYVPSTLTRAEAVSGFGPTQGSEVSATNAAAWHAAGLVASGVKVGIVDFFDLTKWTAAEHGPVPDASHQFCRDSSGIAPSLCNPDGTISTAAVLNTDAGSHGVAVAEIVRDMAPGVELFVSSVATVSDLAAAVNWFAANGVTIVTRSLGAAFDGPGDGTGPLASVVDQAVSLGITWFNSAGNDAIDTYVRRSVPTTLAKDGYVDWNDGRGGLVGVDEWLRIDSLGCYFLDGVRWANDWYLPPAQRTDYRLEVWEPTSFLGVGSDHVNPGLFYVTPIVVTDAGQSTGSPPLEGVDQEVCPNNGYGPTFGGNPPLDVTYIRLRRNPSTPVGLVPDQVEVGISGPALTELGYSDAPFSAAKPVVDSRNPGLVAVGAVDPPPTAPGAGPYTIGEYSSQGPTNDGRVKPDVSAPSGFTSTIFGTFSGTSASAPTAAGFAALLQGAGLAQPGAGLAALVKHFVRDLGAPGPDNAYGTGIIELPEPPTTPPAPTPSRYVSLPVPPRILDTRQGGLHVGPSGTVGPYAPQAIIDFDVVTWGALPAGVSAVAVNLTSVAPPALGFVQAYPYLRASNGGTSTLNIPTVGVTRPNFAIVPVGKDGNISVYIQAGGDVILDLLGYYVEGQTSPADGRFVPLGTPERWLDTRGNGAPLPAVFGGVPRRVLANEAVNLPMLPATQVPGLGEGSTVEALVVNIAAANAAGPGFVRAYAGAVQQQGSNVNYVPGSASANTAIVPISQAGAFNLFTSQTTDIIVDVVGYITSPTAPASPGGTFVPLTPTRAYDTRALSQPFAAGETRGFYITGGSTGVPDGIGGVSANLTVVAPAGNGFLKVYPGLVPPPTASVNYAAGKTVANGALVGTNQIGVSNSVTAAMSQSGHLIIDINGYFVAAPS